MESRNGPNVPICRHSVPTQSALKCLPWKLEESPDQSNPRQFRPNFALDSPSGHIL
jgi:hypothetical protein